MGGVRLRRGGMYAADMAAYARLLSEENTNSEELAGLRQKVAMAMRQELTPMQRKYFRLYYVEHMKMVEIAAYFGVDKSTVSRTIQRAEQNLRRCLRFGAASLLDQVGFHTPYHAVRQYVKREGYENC